jgi:hypothetical protein
MVAVKATVERSRAAPARSTSSAQQQAFFKAIQTKLTVNATGDRHEREAEATADRVMRMPSGDRLARSSTSESDRIQRAEAAATSTAPAAVSDAVQSGIRSQQSGGQRLDGSTRQFMESRFGADFGAVRVHHDAEAAGLSSSLGARAFTTGNHVFFGAGQYSPGTSEGRHLLAHELTHTIQQGAAVQRSPQVEVSASTPHVQRWGLGDALDLFADKANYLPGFRMLTVVLGFNPINRAPVDRSAGNILRALIELLPLGTLITAALANYGVFERAGAWVQAQLAAFGNLAGQIRAAIDVFMKGVSWKDIANLSGLWERGKSIFTGPIDNLIAFGQGLVSGLMDLVREAILRPLAELLRPTRGYDLLCAVLGRDPVTGDAVPRTAETLIGGFMKFIGRQDIWDNLRKGNAVTRAWLWFQAALAGLMGFVKAVPGQVVATLRSITWQDVVSISGVLGKVIGLFASLGGSFVSWAVGTVVELLEILFSVVAPGVIPYVKKAQGAFRSILDNPIGFVGNLVHAGRLGFERFGLNILEHLKAGLIKWITGPLGDAGVYIPKSFSLGEIVKLVLSVLGLTWQNIRAKLVKIIPEPVLVVLEKSAAILVTLVKEGPAAAWEQIKAELDELKSMLIEQVTTLVSTEIVKAAVTKIVSMINPAGAVIQAILAIYNTVMFFVERISQLAATVASFIDSIAAIASGKVTAAAQRVEQTLASTLVLVISFLARLVGLGGIPQRLVGIVQKIRKPIDKGLDRIVDWLGALLKKIGSAAKGAVASFLSWWRKKEPVSGGGESHTLTFEGERTGAQLVLKSVPKKPSKFLEELASAKKLEDKKSKAPIAECRAQESSIAATQASLEKFDDPSKPTPSGSAADQADKLSKKLDKQLSGLAAHLGDTLVSWNVGDAIVGKVSVPRKKFTYEMKAKLAERHKDKSELREDSKGRLVNLQRGLARRHIVSSSDMAKHYERAITGKKLSEAKLLLEQRGSAPASRTPVESLTEDRVSAAANQRHLNFFGYTRNLFIGDSAENSSIQEELDRGEPGMAKAERKLLDHVSHIKRLWALDSSITISGLDGD